jgi:hypothetical protein
MKSEIIFAIFCRAFVLLGPLPFTDVRSLSLGKRLGRDRIPCLNLLLYKAF